MTPEQTITAKKMNMPKRTPMGAFCMSSLMNTTPLSPPPGQPQQPQLIGHTGFTFCAFITFVAEADRRSGVYFFSPVWQAAMAASVEFTFSIMFGSNAAPVIRHSFSKA